jgi:hypothetical protein
MPNWVCKITSAVQDASGGNANINITLTATNSVSNEVQTRILPGSNWTAVGLKYHAEQLIKSLNERDAALPIAQAAATAQTTLATG